MYGRCDLGLFDLRAVVANLCPAFARAKLARGTLDSLGLEEVPVGIGTEGGASGLEDTFTRTVAATGYVTTSPCKGSEMLPQLSEMYGPGRADAAMAF